MFLCSKNNYQKRNLTSGFLICVFGLIVSHQDRTDVDNPVAAAPPSSDVKSVNITAMTTVVFTRR